MNSFSFTPCPAELVWENPPQAWKCEQQTLSITAGAQTDLFTDPAGTVVVNSSPRAIFSPTAGDFLLSAKVEVGFQSTFDAGVLMLYHNAEYWAKLCFEYSPQRQPMVVSVINRGVSDDCNSVVINGNVVYLRIAKIGKTFAFHYSLDGRYWHFVRYFTFGIADAVRIGFSSQAPTGEGCTAMFSEVAYTQTTLKDTRNGE